MGPRSWCSGHSPGSGIVRKLFFLAAEGILNNCNLHRAAVHMATYSRILLLDGERTDSIVLLALFGCRSTYWRAASPTLFGTSTRLVVPAHGLRSGTTRFGLRLKTSNSDGSNAHLPTLVACHLHMLLRLRLLLCSLRRCSQWRCVCCSWGR